MKLMVINPDYGMTSREMEERCHILQSFVGSDVTLEMDCLHNNKVYIDSVLDVMLASAEIIQMAIEAEKKGFDAIILYCFSDPAIDACREAVRIPVIGGGQAACMLATTIARQFTILTTDKKRIPEKRLFIYQTGINPDRVDTIESIDLHGKAIREDIDYTVQTVSKQCKELVAGGAQAVVLGCLSFLGMGPSISKNIGVPVIDAAVAAVGLAETLVRQQLKTSKESYPCPPMGERSWQEGRISI